MLAQKAAEKDTMGESSMQIKQSRIKQIIQEELARSSTEPATANEAFGMHKYGSHKFEPEEKLVTVTEEELIEARHAAYYLIKNSLESGADSVSLEETVRRVYGYNVPSYILELFSDDAE